MGVLHVMRRQSFALFDIFSVELIGIQKAVKKGVYSVDQGL